MGMIIRPGRMGRRSGLGTARAFEPSFFYGLNPKNLGGGTIKFWVRGDLGITLNGSNVSAWADRSGNGFNVLQVTPSLQPAFVASGQGNRPYVLFDGVDDILIATSANLFGSGAYTIFAVTKLVSVGASIIFFENATGSLANGVSLGTSSSNRTVSHQGVADHSDAAATTNAEIWGTQRAAASAPTLKINGVNQALSNSGSTGLTDPGVTSRIALGASSFPLAWANVQIYEIICYSTNLTDSELALLTQYAKARYRI